MAAVALQRCALDVTRIAPHLYQGSRPAIGASVRRCGFDVLVLTAKEWQPPDSAYPGVSVLRVPLVDQNLPLTEQAWLAALGMSRRVALELADGKRVLTTCHAGLNRSGLVNVITLHRLTGISGKKLVRYLRATRPGALSNTHFASTAEAMLLAR